MMLSVRGVTVRYDDVVALDDVSFDVGPEETVAVLGSSGSGKTTLLRVVAGLHVPDSGTVAWEGSDLAAVPPHLRRFGLVFQDFALFPHLDVAGNVGFGLRVAGMGGSDLASRVAHALQRVGLSGLGARRIEELSGGQAQRVALARTLATTPRLLLLDEPLGSLDPALRRGLAADLAATLAAEPVPTLLVTHDTDEAFALADRVAVMDRGRIVRIDTPEAVWQQPETAAVAALLGHSVVSGSFAGMTPGPGSSLAIRPDAVHLSPDGEHEATVIASAFRGPEWVVTVDVGGVRVPAAAAAHRRSGERVQVTVDRRAIAEVTP
ncbi:MAG: ABC transporter ATP-binding protein [Acidimicrobiia bacterium]|nr:ABC transporter ATP-binding protein [Acidimicrobiia bacterium]